ncbi:DUF3343 domain-containing protein [Thermodesulfovibrio yellowstonii]|uniref:Se/S carrier protein-like domain-containing protein n=1 Tax=Thermodesulfovibrio yellowstonii TaxID=28262 RepID=A0A9W6GDA0_9BACT|nr:MULTISPECIES: DUF3343 domain-containing protein [Thermodesulfovibrio]MDI6865179.1 DUF3343 domain-containing protein [Thermodesulfovibrio yellowstonii]GLI53108.1 hypothetical protein TISLANDTSLP1_08010 [Thermodesulfovibrio islandicus]
MKIFKKLFRNNKKNSSNRGILIFENTSEVIRAENILKKQGYEIKVVGPPPHVRKGCDLAIDFPIVETVGILKLLKDYELSPIDYMPSNDGNLKPVDLFHVKDFGRFIMVRAANMKITVHKGSLTIVNVSGGGCPDVPYLAAMLVGKNIYEVPEPNEIGHTLCGYALQLAYDKIKELCLQS